MIKYTEEERNAAFGYLLALHIRRTLERIRPELSWNRNNVDLDVLVRKPAPNPTQHNAHGEQDE